MEEQPKDSQAKIVEDAWIDRANNLGYKTTTVKYREAMSNYFIGAMIAMNYNVPYWVICIQSGRDIGELVRERQSKFRQDLLIQVDKLERHTYAPEMNTLHFLDRDSIKTPQCLSIDEAINYVIKNKLV